MYDINKEKRFFFLILKSSKFYENFIFYSQNLPKLCLCSQLSCFQLQGLGPTVQKKLHRSMLITDLHPTPLVPVPDTALWMLYQHLTGDGRKNGNLQGNVIYLFIIIIIIM